MSAAARRHRRRQSAANWKRRTTCAVPECAMPVSYPNNLCEGHRLPGFAVFQGPTPRTFLVFGWYTESGEYIRHGEHAPSNQKTPPGNGWSQIVTCWYAEHGDESGVIFLNDWGLGQLFGGRQRFEAKLLEQGFSNVRNLTTPEELEAAKQPAPGKKVGKWSGPWLTHYPWEMN